MTPTNWNGITALLLLAGLLGSLFAWNEHRTKSGERIAMGLETLDKTVKGLGETMSKLEGHFQHLLHTQAIHTTRIDDLTERTAWLETCMETDGKAPPVMLRLQHRRRMGDSA